MKKSQYKIELMSVKELKVNPNNPRLIKGEAFKNLVKSLEDCPELFDARPCLVSSRTGENIILGGNMRYRAALELGWDTVPVIIMEGITEAQEKEIAVKDNADAFGQWNWDILANDWDDLPLVEWGIKMNKFDQDDPNKEWEGMPEFNQDDKSGMQIIVSCENKKDREDFFNLLKQPFTDKTKSIWYPEKKRGEEDQLGHKEGLRYSNES